MKTSVLTDRTTAAPTKIVLTQRVPLAVFQVNEAIKQYDIEQQQ